ncbi:HAMP domain-containing protein,histidine kinase,cache domain-containing protein [Thermobacillus composti KWC4]|jgi:two-component system sensor histidine kinase YesM|uniref:HAMP domain-containing protein,histidine kinase,cache domain-containing protein n=1 Tax=Thermobacillus composti (strain DSM 18247 / JCM 13945 / KWC4) TaxID=717605 RepID=L0EAW6_THECK|nr:sensor histidine kinase [Thermobacillus composti]AGA57398.1 HAMP domain-containing protein,histidine kinase,cache domain-containing protein [Thermobacillus composti KWC4]
MNVLDAIRRSIKWKLVTLLAAVLLAVILLVVYLTYRITSETVIRDAEVISSQMLKQVNLNLNQYLNGYKQSFLSIASNRDTEKWFTIGAGDDLGSYVAFQEIVRNYLQVFIYHHPEVMSLTFYNLNGNEMHFTNQDELRADYTFRAEDYIERLGAESDIYHEITFPEHYRRSTQPVLTMVKRVAFGRRAGYIKLDVDLGPALAIVTDTDLGLSGKTMVTDGKGEIIVHPDLSRVKTYADADIIARLGETSGTFYRKDSREIVMFQTVPATGWKVMAVIPYYEFAENELNIRRVTIATVLIGLVLALAVVFAVVSSATHRIGTLRSAISRVKIGDLGVRVPAGGSDELADLGHAFNLMLDRLNDSVQELAETRMRQQEATMSALQSQIDSHFLYNSLETINAMADLAGHREIERIAVALSRMLRYTSDYRQMFVTVEDELQHLKHYLEICRIRFGEKLSYAIEAEDDCRRSKCLKAIIQPLAENSIRHNLDLNGRPLRLEIKVRRADSGHVRIDILDDGTGFAPEKLRELREKIACMSSRALGEHAGGVGLLNVHSRIRVCHAADPLAGVSVSNREGGGGAAVSVMFPFDSPGREEPA